MKAEMCSGLTEENLADYEAHWLPPLRAARMPGWHWDWRDFHRTAVQTATDWATGHRHELPHRCFALEVGGALEGLLYLSYEYRSRLENPAHAVRVERLIAAPWNQRSAARRRYIGVGETLLRHAVWESFELGWEGRVGLESLPDAEGWYRNRGMLPVPPLAEASELALPFLEFTASAAYQFHGYEPA